MNKKYCLFPFYANTQYLSIFRRNSVFINFQLMKISYLIIKGDLNHVNQILLDKMNYIKLIIRISPFKIIKVIFGSFASYPLVNTHFNFKGEPI